MIEVKQINNELRDKAVNCGLCKQWQNDWEKEWDLERMASQFYRGIDFYLKNRFIPKDYFKNAFGLDYLRKKGCIVDDIYSLTNPENCILIGNSQSTVRVNAENASNIYVIDDSKLKVIARNRSFVIVHALDNAQIEAWQYDNARVVIIRHSEDIKITTNGNVKVKEELDYLK